MAKVFISYRRADSQYVTDAIYLQMENLFGQGNVFLDVGDIPFGVDFRQYLREQIEAHDVVLVIIGPDWGRIMQERAEQANDFVRIEIENALKLNKLLIPVLVMEAKMPDFSSLPPSISDLQWRNSAQIRRHPDLANDCQRLADSISNFLINPHESSSIGKSMSVEQNTQIILDASKSKNLMPLPFDWCYISAGEVRLEEGGYIPKGGRIFGVDAFYMAKYPVTNAQFEKFVDAGGYQEQKWWTKSGWEFRQKERWTEPHFWKDSEFNADEQPVVGVSWYESVAFCLWMTDTTNEKIMLPTEIQWQRAAQGNDGRVYPWGNDWDASHCNNKVDKIGMGKPTPVRRYEKIGDSPFGVVDMAGNVWEWCLTDYHNQDNNLDSIVKARVLHGGSWLSTTSDTFLCNCRNLIKPNERHRHWGFRLSLSLS